MLPEREEPMKIDQALSSPARTSPTPNISRWQGLADVAMLSLVGLSLSLFVAVADLASAEPNYSSDEIARLNAFP